MNLTESNKHKFETFLEVAGNLNKKFNVVPVLFGSLGLYKLIGDSGKNANDIDFLIPKEFINERWKEFSNFVESFGFRLENEKEHGFSRDGYIIAFGDEMDLFDDFGLKTEKLLDSEIKGVKFKELTPKQYFLCYQLMLRDNYRQEKRGDADKEKIKLIENYLANKNLGE